MINPGLMHLIITIVVLIISYLFSIAINRAIQSTLARYVSTSINSYGQSDEHSPLINIGFVQLFFMLYFLVGWPISMPIDSNSVDGRYRYLRLFILYSIESIVSLLVAFFALGISVLLWGFGLTNYFVQIGFADRTKLLPFISGMFQGYSSTMVLVALFISFIIFLNMLFAVFTLISNALRLAVVIGQERGYKYAQYEDAINFFGLVFAIFFLANPIYLYLLKFIMWCLNYLAQLFGM